MRIPRGNFGYKTPDHVQYGAVSHEGSDAVPRALQNLADTTSQIASNAMNQELSMLAQQKQEDQALARAKAGNAVLDREIEIKTLLSDGEKRLQDGSLTHETFSDYYSSSLKKLNTPQISGLDPASNENFNKGLKRAEAGGLSAANEMTSRAKAIAFKGETDLAIDNFGKLAGFPGADVSKINMQIDSLDSMGSVAYGGQWQRVKQGMKDANWYNQANQKAMQGKDDMQTLKQLEYDLTSEKGFYTGKLDTEKRNSLLRGVINNRLQLESKIEHEAGKAQAHTAINLNKIDQQIASGIPIEQDQWDKYASQSQGTGLEVEIVNRMKQEMEVQDVLRMPIEKQVGFVQEKQAQIKQGGDLAEAANVERMRRTVENNVKQLQDSPLLFNQSRTGVPVQPVAIETLLQPDGAAQVQSIFNDRVASIKTMQGKYGDQVKMRPLLEQESNALVSMLDRMEPAQQGQLFSTLRQSFPDTNSYVAAMQQIAPDSPIKARAGAMIAVGGSMTMERHWFSPDVAASAEGVANTLLTGENILNKTKSQKSEDGKTKSFPVPPESNFRQFFSTEVGAAYADNPDVYESDMQAVRAYYVGRAAEEGDVSGEIDQKRLTEAVRSVVGEVVNVNGGKEVIAPWGMDKSTFTDRLDVELINKLKALNVSDRVIEDRDSFGFRNAGNGKYFVMAGRNYKVDASGKPIVIDVRGGTQ
jgi:hypothetical protein